MNKLITALAIFLIFIISGNSYASFELIPGTSGKVVTIFIDGVDIYAGVENGGVRYSNNNGDTWSNITNNLGQITVNEFLYTGNTIFAATGSGVFKTTNNGSSWVPVNFGVNSAANFIKISGNNIYAGKAGFIYISTDMGSTWSTIWDGTFNSTIGDILFHDNKIFVASGNRVYVSLNGGTNWSYENNLPGAVNILQAFGNTIRVGTSGGFKNTTPTGGWVSEQPWGNYTYAFAVVGNFIMHGGNVGIFWSSDNGVTWHDPGYPFLFTNNVYSMAQNSEYVFAGATNGIYRKSTTSFTGISQIGTSIPEKFSLSQNYPNPFNPETNIKFGLPKTSGVTLIVYNQLGQSVARLINENLSAGEYEYNFDASVLPSGVYYYKLTAGEYSDIKKMILVK
jgi:photosystem II stability/assembly factor-like uncharacterized protein